MINSPKMVQRKTKQNNCANGSSASSSSGNSTNNTSANPPREDADPSSKLDDFDISSLSALSDVDLSCADEVLRETYDTFSTYSAENVDSPESLNSILAGGPVQLIDQVLRNSNVQQTVTLQKEVANHVDAAKSYSMMSANTTSTSVAAVAAAVAAASTEPSHYTENGMVPSQINYQRAAAAVTAATCRQYLTSAFGDILNDEHFPSQVAAAAAAAAAAGVKVDGQFLSTSAATAFDGNANQMVENVYGSRQYHSNFLLEMQVEDESSFSYSKWLNEM